MKLQLETIPVWDGVKEGSECFLCSLMKQAEDDGVRYYLSSAVMTPEVRVETNTKGFCTHHFLMLADGGKAQSLGLVMDTYYEESSRILDPYIDKSLSAGNARKAMKAVNAFVAKEEERERGCLICTRMEDRLMRYCYTIASLWKEDPEFRSALLASKGFCVHHTKELALRAKEALSGDDLAGFLHDIFSLLKSNLERVKHDDWWLTQMYKSENRDKDWNGCEDAHRRAVCKLVGEHHVIDPIK